MYRKKTPHVKVAFAIFQYLLNFCSDWPVMLQLKPVEGLGGDRLTEVPEEGVKAVHDTLQWK